MFLQKGNTQPQIQQAKVDKEEVITTVCIICCENQKESVFVPCGHKCCCLGCAKKFINKHKCPFCKKSVESIIEKVYE